MDMPRIYNSRLPGTPLLRAQTVVCGEMYMKYMHMRCTCGCSDGWVDRDLDRASLVNTECLHVEKHIHAIAAQSIFSCLIAVDVKLVLYKHPIITNQDEGATTDQLLPHIMQVVS